MRKSTDLFTELEKYPPFSIINSLISACFKDNFPETANVFPPNGLF